MVIKKHHAFIQANFIIPVYNIEEKYIAKFAQLISNARYIQRTEPTKFQKKNVSFFITTKTDYSKVVKEVHDIVMYIYPNHSERDSIK